MNVSTNCPSYTDQYRMLGLMSVELEELANALTDECSGASTTSPGMSNYVREVMEARGHLRRAMGHVGPTSTYPASRLGNFTESPVIDR